MSISLLPSGSSPEPAVFHFFSQLPPELRLKVWQYSQPRGRAVPVHLDNSPLYERQCYPGRSSRGCVSPAQIPSNLHVSHEARSESLKRYALSFGLCQGPGQIFFNPEEDILYFGECEDQWETESQFRLFTTMVDPEELELVQRAAINDAIFWSEPEYISSIAARLTVDIIDTIRTKLPNLKELIFVSRDSNPSYSTNMTLEKPGTPDLRLLHQIHEGMQFVAQAHTEWRAPDWSVKVLTSQQPNHDFHHQYSLPQQRLSYGLMEGVEMANPYGNMDQGVLRCFAGF
ncbi:uncharacterized protein MKZ38_005402 [Zalerion maritima]|uniref:2EXR domain-containing protein n=1 Tax=Zalerion maritima TaxID=339359 RepID=A0AAD5WP04_9PEZI|nr:uncharacterized protein MKZ38_005402 [Zalerion maritima]